MQSLPVWTTNPPTPTHSRLKPKMALSEDEVLELSYAQRRLAARRGKPGYGANTTTLQARVYELEAKQSEPVDNHQPDVTG